MIRRLRHFRLLSFQLRIYHSRRRTVCLSRRSSLLIRHIPLSSEEDLSFSSSFALNQAYAVPAIGRMSFSSSFALNQSYAIIETGGYVFLVKSLLLIKHVPPMSVKISTGVLSRFGMMACLRDTIELPLYCKFYFKRRNRSTNLPVRPSSQTTK